MRIDPTIAVAIIAALGSALSLFFTNRYAARSARAAQESAERQKAVQIDSESFARARANYDAANLEQERRIARLHQEMEEDRAEYRREAEACKQQIIALRRDLTALREWSRPLLQRARAVGIQYGDPPVWLGDTNPGG